MEIAEATLPDPAAMFPPENKALVNAEIRLFSSQIQNIINVTETTLFFCMSLAKNKTAPRSKRVLTTSWMGRITTVLCKDGYHSKSRTRKMINFTTLGVNST